MLLFSNFLLAMGIISIFLIQLIILPVFVSIVKDYLNVALKTPYKEQGGGRKRL
jgi:hypothetical protein